MKSGRMSGRQRSFWLGLAGGRRGKERWTEIARIDGEGSGTPLEFRATWVSQLVSPEVDAVALE